jgi:glycosyltransferase involved in cell wall biosynthesis
LLLPITVSLVRANDVAGCVPERDWSAEIELLTVSRLEPEKNPLLLVEALRRLECERPGRYRLTWIGRGVLESRVRRRAAELGVAERLNLCGYVPFGPRLMALYRRAHIFVLVSLTEGVPQVLVEALSAGTPSQRTSAACECSSTTGEPASSYHLGTSTLSSRPCSGSHTTVSSGRPWRTVDSRSAGT